MRVLVLGTGFGHIERTRVLLHLVSAREGYVAHAYSVCKELEAYGHEIDQKKKLSRSVKGHGERRRAQRRCQNCKSLWCKSV